MNRRKIAGLIAALIAGLALAASATAGNDERVLYRNLPVQAKLERSMDIDFQGATLAEVLQFFRDKLRIAIVLDPASADLAKKPITIAVQDVPAGKALSLALRQVRLQYGVSLGIVWVGDRAYVESQEPLVYRQYDVADITISVAPGSFMTASGSPEDSNINKPAAGRKGAAGDEALSALRTSGDRRNAEKSVASGGPGNSSIQKESEETGF